MCKVADLPLFHDLVRPYHALVDDPSIDPVVFFQTTTGAVFLKTFAPERLLLRQVADRLSKAKG